MSNLENLASSEKYPFPSGIRLPLIRSNDFTRRPYDVMNKTIYIELDEVLTENGIVTKITDSRDSNNYVIISHEAGTNYYSIDASNIKNADNLTKYQFRNAISDLIPLNAEVKNSTIVLTSLGFRNVQNGWIKIGNPDIVRDLSAFIRAGLSNGQEGILNLIKVFNTLGMIPDTKFGSRIKERIIDYHNMYFETHPHDLRPALLNYISTWMFNISRSPRNLIQGQTGIDTAANRIKDYPNGKNPKYTKLSEKTKHFDRGTVLSKMRMAVLTLTGKDEVGIMASSMKTFEAMSLYFYQVLNTGTFEELEDLLVNRKIAGYLIDLIANAATSNLLNIKSSKIKEALKRVDNYEDAFILMSAFLSLATDNAKDPTLSKINADPNMIGLYTAGFCLGIPLNTLLDIMMSDTALMLARRTRTNVFNETESKITLKSVISSLLTPPNTSDLSKKNVKFLEDLAKILYPGLKVSEILGDTNKGKNFVEIARVLARRYTDSDNGDSLIGSTDLEDSLDENTIPFIIRNERERRKKSKVSRIFKDNILRPLLRRLRKTKSEKRVSELQNEILNAENILKNIELKESRGEVVDNSDLGEYENNLNLDITDNQIKEMLKLSPSKRQILLFLDEALDWYEDRNLIFNETETIVGPDNEEHNIFRIIQQLHEFSEEMGNLRNGLKLNQGLPNSVEEQMTWIRDFEKMLLNRIADYKKDYNYLSSKDEDSLTPQEVELLNRYKEVDLLLENLSNKNNEIYDFQEKNNYRVNLVSFVSNSDYRNLVQKLYNRIKFAVSPFSVLWGVAHYRGYLTTMAGLTKIGLSHSELYRTINFLSDIISKSWNLNNDEIQKYSKKLEKFIVSELNNSFLLSKGLLIRITSPAIVFNSNGDILNDIPKEGIDVILGTASGNSSFKSWMEKVIFPALKDEYKTNYFVRSLLQQPYTFNLNNKTTINYSLGINTSPQELSERQLFDQVKNGLNILYNKTKIGSHNLGDLNFGDLLFLYNMIVYGGSNINGSFISLFEDKVRYRNSQLINDYNGFYNTTDIESNLNYIGALDSEGNLNQDFIRKVEIFIAPTVGLNELTNSRSKFKFVWVLDPDTKRKILLSRKNKKTNNNSEDLALEQSGISYEDLGISPEESGTSYEGLGMSPEDLGMSPDNINSEKRKGLESILKRDDCVYVRLKSGFSDYNRNFYGITSTDYENKNLVINNKVLFFGDSLSNINPDDIGDVYIKINNRTMSLDEYIKSKNNKLSAKDIIEFKTIISENGKLTLIIDPKQTEINLEGLKRLESCK